MFITTQPESRGDSIGKEEGPAVANRQVGSDSQSDRSHSSPIPMFHFRSVATQVLLVSAAGFCTIGAFNALQGLGGAGQEKPYVVNAATSINFGLMGLVCLFAGGPVINVIGIKWALTLGTVGDPLFGAAVYQNSRYGTQWFLIFAAVFRGACSGLFWAAEGYVFFGYPRPQWRSRSISTWVAFKEMGSVISAAINLGISAHDNAAGSVSYSVYYVTITIMCLAFPIALLLSPTAKVRHSDGTRVLTIDDHRIKQGDDALLATPTFSKQYRALYAQLRKPETLLMIPWAIFAYFYYSFSHTYVTKHFSVRGRALASLLTSVASIIGSLLVAMTTDLGQRFYRRNGGKSRLRELYITTGLVLVLTGGSWAYFAYHAINPPAKKLDWVDPGYGATVIAVVLLFMSMQAAQTYLYWLAGQGLEDVRAAAHLSGVVRGIESLGQCVAYGINTSSRSPVASIAPNLATYVVGGISLIFLVRRKGMAAMEGTL